MLQIKHERLNYGYKTQVTITLGNVKVTEVLGPEQGGGKVKQRMDANFFMLHGRTCEIQLTWMKLEIKIVDDY